MKNSALSFLFETAVRFPERVCISDERGSLTFGAFMWRAFIISQKLATSQDRNEPILIFLPKGTDAVVAFAAALMSGNFYVPVDIKAPDSRLAKIIINLSPSVVITQSQFRQRVIDLTGSSCEIIVVDEVSPAADTMGNVNEVVAACERPLDAIIDTDPCYVMYTSGSTGDPKGVVVSHRGVIDYIDWAVDCLSVDEKEILGNQAPLFFDNSTLDIYLSWATGAHLLLIPEKLFMFPVQLIEYLERRCISFVFFVPSVLSAVSKLKALSEHSLPALRKIVFAGEVMPAKHLAYWQRLLPDRQYVNLYGPTEITVDCTYYFLDRIFNPEESIPIGYPCRNSAILVLNERDQAASIGEQGELCVRGSSLALGYWNDPQKSASVFCQNPLQKHYFDRIYRTGDLVYRDEEDRIIFVGRKDSQIKLHGYRIELGEIERAAETLPFVQRAVAVFVPTREELHLYYEGNEAIKPHIVIKGLAELIPHYMVPRVIQHVAQFPINENGKIDRKTLLESSAARANRRGSDVG